MTAPLRLFNSLTRELETFEPVHPGEARVYSCGPTVYNYPHIGNMRAYVFADVLGRTLSWKGYKLTHVINVTDVGHLTDDADAGEDKLEQAARTHARSIWEIAEHYTEAYWADVKALNIRQPAQWTIATRFVPQMLEFAKSIAGEHCYELNSGLYFDVSTVADYGRLARAVTDEGEGRIETVAGKRNAADFAIWRKTPPGETRQMEWDSPWGRGAPGWHLECSVMSQAVLGFPFDIHTGGIDHREIHHPNEIAQNQAFCHSDASGANIWMHNNFLVERSGKMSKSSGEFLRLDTLKYRGFHAWSYRMMCLQAHYRSELEFSWEGLEAAQSRLKRLLMQTKKLQSHYEDQYPSALRLPYKRATLKTASAHTVGPLEGYLERFDEAISDDLNTPKALVVLEELIKERNAPVDEHLRQIRSMLSVLGLGLRKLSVFRRRPAETRIALAHIEAALARRKEARAARDFAASDAIRDELAAQGVEVMDGDPLGWEWKLGA
ncbi:MAG: cysteine--tRNA ligase [Croceibacterium sp.]